jgi:hypothetical protein
LPTFFKSPAPAMPSTTVQKMIGAMIILISLMKPSPSGFMAAPVEGEKAPNSAPHAIATSTWKYSDR